MKSFVFQSPLMLVLLLIVVPLFLILRYARQRRLTVLRELGEQQVDLRRFYWRDGLRLGGLVLLIIALARPGTNPQRQSLSQSGRDVVFVLDVSRSMLAEDVSPNRLEVAKDSIRDTLNRLSSERVGLVVYAGSANIMCPLTFDHNFVRYMLDQATTRAVDFGGTTLLSAVEKCVDSVVTDDRENMHDLIVMTDGEEHSDSAGRISELLENNGVGLLLVGIGDDTTGARIPVLDEEGKQAFLKYKDEVVTTKLQSAALKSLVASIDDAEYHNVGTKNFDLPSIYYDFVADKPVSGSIGDDSFVVYQESGFPLMWIALALLLIAEGRFLLSGKKWLLVFLVVQLGQVTADEDLKKNYQSAIEQQQGGRYAEALENYSAILQDYSLSNHQHAAVTFNQGLCFLKQAEANAEQQPETALSLTKQAQLQFLSARRLDPTFDRPAQRLDGIAKLIVRYQQMIAEQQQQQQEIQEQMQKLVERLQALYQSQMGLVGRIPARRKRNPIMPETAEADSRSLQVGQQKVNSEAIDVNLELIAIDSQLSGSQPITLLAEPRSLMSSAMEAQQRALPQLKQWSTWMQAKVDQNVAADKIAAIIDLLSDSSNGESGEESWDDEEYWDESEYSESEDSVAASIDGQGDFSGSSEMQALPTPNYSVQDILQQEQGSLQFRQQQRASANKGKIDKDW